MKKFFKWFFIISIILILSVLIGLGFYISSVYSNAKKLKLNEETLSLQSLKINIYDNDSNLINEDNEIDKNYISIDSINENTKNAFISTEDKNFYNHKGISYKRIIKAGLNNIRYRKLKEGASTITQQLVKNTFLNSEKTFERKIKEVALAQKIENRFTKDQILEKYLNVIYFGNNCYGIENASNYYFSKSANDLSLEEASLLAGVIKSPSRYSPIKNSENCLKRRNLVLNEMYKDRKISLAQYTRAKNKKISLNINNSIKNKLNSFSQASIDEAEDILGLPAKQIALAGYKIYTYQDKKSQKNLENAFNNIKSDCDSAGIVIDNSSHAVKAYIGKSNYKILDTKRQPGSCIKPILVYGPALNEDIITPATQLLDEKTSIGEYSPKNVGNIYHGFVSARESLAKSINIPAVKVLSYVGIDKAKAYANDMGISFDEKDDSYTLALGGMTYGTTIKELAGAYSSFTNGKYACPKFISFITDKNDKLVYLNNQKEKEVLREDSAYLLTDMLKTCAQNGTAKRLNSLEIDIASKTGTVGRKSGKENLDAWNISYTQNQTCAVWLGNLDNTPIPYAGGNQPTEIVKQYFSQQEDNSRFVIPESIIEKDIDAIELNENHRIILANNFIPERYTKKEIFSVFNTPNDVSTRFVSSQKTKISSYVEGNNAIIQFCAKDFMTYKIKTNNKTVKEISGKYDDQKIVIPLSSNKQKIYFESFYTLSPEIREEQELDFIKTKKTISKEKWFL